MSIDLKKLNTLTAPKPKQPAPVEDTEILDTGLPQEEESIVEEMETIEEVKPEPVKPKTVVKPRVRPTTNINPAPAFTKPITPTGKNSFFTSIKTIIKDVKENTPAELEDGTYTGMVDKVDLMQSQKGKNMLKVDIIILTKRGLPAKGKATRFMILEHENQQVVEISLRQITNMLFNVGIVIGDETDLEAVFNNMTDYFKNKPLVFEVKKGFINFKEFNGKRV